MNIFLKGFAAAVILLNAGSVAFAQTEVYFSPKGGCQKAVIAQIDQAHKSIDVAMYAFTSREVARAILGAQDRHVRVKVILDPGQIKDMYSKSRFLIKKGVDVKFHMGPGLMHNKFAVIDDHVVLTGSYNWTISADKKNSENLLVITDKGLAHQYEKQFRHLWSQSGEGHLKEIVPLQKAR